MSITTAQPTRPAGSEDHPAGRGLPRGRSRVVVGLAVGVAAALTLTGCITVQIPEDAATTTIVHDVSDDITELRLDTSGDVTVELGEPSLTVITTKKMHELLTIAEDDTTLVLDQRPMFGLRPHVEYVLTVRSLDAVHVDGSGHVTADFSHTAQPRITLDGSGQIVAQGLDAQALTIELDGSGSIRLDGTVDTATFSLDGSGSITARDLAVRAGTLSLGGSGSIDANVTGEVDAHLEGSGSMRIEGGARVISREVEGSGDISIVP